MKKIFTLIFALVSASQINVDAADEYGLSYQSLLPDFQKLTPEAAALGSHGNIDASEYTGQPNIQIPLYTVSVGDINVPIYLSYDASGIKVEQQASFVGLGWNLIYGGCVNRIICGQEDNLSGRSTYDYYKNTLSDFVEIENTVAPIISSTVNVGKEQFGPFNLFEDIKNGYFQPDIYQASFCGHSVSFTLYHDTIVVIGDDASKYEITFGFQKSRVVPNTFTIKDDQGIVYFFRAYQENSGAAYSYYLERITGQRQEYVTIEYFQDTKQLVSPITLFQSMGSAIDGEITPDVIMNQFIALQSRNSSTSLYKVYPTAIKTSKETVSFNFDYGRQDIPTAKSLNSITVTSKNGERQTHSIYFGYNYFVEDRRTEALSMELLKHSLSNYSAKRLKLDSVTVDSETYVFEYDATPLPYNTSLSQDFWGYYNGMSNTKNFCCTPKYIITTEGLVEQPTIGNANRYCSPAVIKAGILTKIKYPTGGSTQFAFEPNEFTDPDGYCYPTAEAIKPYISNATNSYTSYNTYTTQKVQLGILSLSPADSTHNGIYSEKTVDFVVTGDEPDIEQSFSFDKNGNCTVSEYLNVDLFFKGQTRKTYHQTAKNSQTQYSLKVFLRFYGCTAAGGSYDYQYSVCQESENFEKTMRLKLPKGTYHMYAQIEHIDNDRTALGLITATYPTKQPIAPSVLKVNTDEEMGGSSVGAGLRISRIDNFDENGLFVGGKRFKYTGGKLLIPTVRAEKKVIECYPHTQSVTSTYSQPDPVKSVFYYTSSQPSYATICSFGSSTIGYSKVVKEEIDKDNKVVRSTISSFHNEGYQFIGPHNSLVHLVGDVQATMFCYTNEGLNGQLIQKIIKAGNGDTISVTKNGYEAQRMSPILYSVADAPFIPDNLFRGFTYRYNGFYKSNVWNFLTKTIETTYVNGLPMDPVVTTFAYNESNYKQKTVEKESGSQTLKYELFYPSDNKSTGSQDLLDKHILGECTMSKQYLNNRFVGGTEFNYTTHKGIPVISTCYQILPDTIIQEMEVTDYDDYGNIREYKTKDGIYTTIIWSYNHLYPVLQVVGVRYKDIKGYVTSLESAKTLSKTTLVTAHSNISGVGGIVTAYLYDAWYGVSDIIAPNKKITHYDRDSQGRLSAIKENSSNGPVIQSFFYKYLTPKK